MRARNVYTIEYYEYSMAGTVKTDYVIAGSKEDAYVQFMNKVNWTVYSAWVARVTYQNGNTREFNTFSGKPYQTII